MILLVAPILLNSCSSVKNYHSDLLTVIGRNELPSATEYEDYDAVVLLKSTEITLNYSSGIGITKRKTFKVVKQLFRNIQDYANKEIKIYHNQKLENLTAKTIRPDSSIVELSSSDFHHISGDDSKSFYSDNEVIKFSFPGIDRGCIIEFEYTVSSYGLFGDNRWYPEYPGNKKYIQTIGSKNSQPSGNVWRP